MYVYVYGYHVLAVARRVNGEPVLKKESVGMCEFYAYFVVCKYVYMYIYIYIYVCRFVCGSCFRCSTT